MKNAIYVIFLKNRFISPAPAKSGRCFFFWFSTLGTLNKVKSHIYKICLSNTISKHTLCWSEKFFVPICFRRVPLLSH